MKSVLLIALLPLFCLTTCAQTNAFQDSISKSICLTIQKDTNRSDSIKVMKALHTHLSSYARSLSEIDSRQLYEIILFKLYRICPEFKIMTDRKFPSKDDFKDLIEEPKSNIETSLCDSFFSMKKFKYLESSGDTTNVIINDSIWVDHFKDGTYSKLSFKRLNDCELEITFLESNNSSRIGFNNQGEKYRYKVLNKTKTYYEIFLEVRSTSKKSITKFYY